MHIFPAPGSWNVPTRNSQSQKEKHAWYKWINGRRNSNFHFLTIKILISGNNFLEATSNEVKISKSTNFRLSASARTDFKWVIWRNGQICPGDIQIKLELIRLTPVAGIILPRFCDFAIKNRQDFLHFLNHGTFARSFAGRCRKLALFEVKSLKPSNLVQFHGAFRCFSLFARPRLLRPDWGVYCKRSCRVCIA